MSISEDLRSDPRAIFFDALEDQRVGMLGVVGSDKTMQPMTHFSDPETGELWFITSAGTDLVRAVGMGARAHHCVMAPDGKLFACASGTLEQSGDREKLDELWSVVAAAWFEDGQDDPDVTLLRLTLQEAAVWTNTASDMVFGIEIARANLEADYKPDLGEHLIIRFDTS